MTTLPQAALPYEIISTPQSSASSAPTLAQLHTLTALPAALSSTGRSEGKKGKRFGGKLQNLDLTFGNDDRVPWSRELHPLKQFTMVQGIEPFTILTTSTSLPTYGSKSFVASDLDNITSFAGVFDQYRIDMIEVLLVPSKTEVTSASSGAGSYVSCVDVDDAATPATYGQLLGYSNAQSSSGTAQHYHRWVPQYAVAAYSGAFTSYSASRGWIDCGSPNVQHYGLKIASTATNEVTAITVHTRYHISFRALH